ncbi:ketopantoate reductase family protein [Bacteroidota bacterium]
MSNKKKICVIGGGAIGGIVAAILKKNEHDVCLLVRNKEHAKEIKEKGLNITGHCGSIHVQIPAYCVVTNLKKRPDIILMATKAPEMPDAIRSILPLIPEETLVVSLQNGIVEEELASIAGKNRTVGCVVGWGATLHSSTEMEMTSSGEFVIGYLDMEADGRIRELAEILSKILPVTISQDILLHLYSKLIINSCISTVGAICGLTLGKMMSKRSYRNLFHDIIREAIEVAKAMDWQIPPYAGKLDYYKLLEWSTFRQHIFLILFGFKYRKLKSSSLQSLERGRKTEVRYFNGYIAKKGREFKVATPVNDRMVELVEEIENGKRQISQENLN